MKYERILLMTHHGFDGKDMNVGKPFGNTTEYDQEASICAFIQLLLMDEGKRCEYLPKTKRQWERPSHWAKDLPITLKCLFSGIQSHISGSYIPSVGDAFPRWNWRGTGETVIVLNKTNSLQNPQITAKDLVRNLLFLL
jgi:hypothetical protein